MCIRDSLNLVDKLQFFVVLKTYPHGLGILFHQRLIWCGIVSRESLRTAVIHIFPVRIEIATGIARRSRRVITQSIRCLLYTSDAADERSSVDLGGRRI